MKNPVKSSSLCRLCADVPGLHSLNETKISPTDGIALKASVALMQYFALNIEEKNELPLEACKTCIDQVETTVRFYNKCHAAQEKHKEILASKKEQQNLITEKKTKKEATVQETKNRKPTAIFTIKDVEKKLGKTLTEDEQKCVESLIKDKNNRQLFRFVYGQGDERIWDCHICNVKVKGKYTELRKHCYEEHHSKLMYSCELCSVKFKYIRQYKRHLEKHFNSNSSVENENPEPPAPSSSGTFVCEVCGKVLKQKNCLLKHTLTHLPEERKNTHPCDVCGKAFPAKGMLTSHKRRVHVEGRPYQCKTCGKSYKTQRSWKDHCEAHLGNRVFTCQTCGMKLSSRQCLKLHILTHTGEKPFNCDVCGRDYHSKSRMLRHKRITHNPNPQFVCNICGKAFRSRTGIEGHKLEHTGETPNVCPICGKAIRAKSNFYAHLKVHRQQASRQTAGKTQTTSGLDVQSFSEQLSNVPYESAVHEPQQTFLQNDRYHLECIDNSIAPFPNESMQFSYTT